EVPGHELERRMRVVVEPTHEPRVHPVIDTETAEPGADLIEEIARFSVEVIGKGRRIARHPLIRFLLRIEDTQRVAFEAPPAVLRQFGDPSREIGNERLAVGGAARRVAQGVELELDALTNAELIEDAAAQRDNLDVGLR